MKMLGQAQGSYSVLAAALFLLGVVGLGPQGRDPVSAASGSAVGAAAQAPPTTYYVDFEKGSDVNSGRSQAEPWQHAPGDPTATGVSSGLRLQPGDVVQFRGGAIYRGRIEPRCNGEEGRPVTYRGGGWGEGRAILDGEGKPGPAFSLGGCNHFRVEGFEVRNWEGGGVHVISYRPDAGSGIAIVDNEIHHIGGDWRKSSGRGIYLRSKGRGALIAHNEIHHTAYTAIVLDGADVTILRNHIHDGDCDGVTGGAGGWLVIDGNLIHDFKNGAAHGDGMQILGWSDALVIRNNIVYNGTQNIFVEPYSNPKGQNPAGDAYIYNNIVCNPEPGPNGIDGFGNGIVIDQRYNTIRSLHVVHNTLVGLNSGSAGFRNAHAAYKVGVQVVKNNVFLNSLASVDPGAVEEKLDADYNLYFNAYRPRGQWYERVLGREPHSVWADAGLVDIQGFDFRLREGSPAIDSAEAPPPLRGDVRFNTDILGRPRGDKPDRGAVEFRGEDTRPLIEAFKTRLVPERRS